MYTRRWMLYLSRIGEMPFFMLPWMGSVIGQQQLSFDDIYIWGERERPLHPFLLGAVLVIVNRRQRRVPDAGVRWSSTQRPLFLIRVTSGQLIAATCALEGDILIVQPHSSARARVMTFRLPEVEVIGHITAVVRTIAKGSGDRCADRPK